MALTMLNPGSERAGGNEFFIRRSEPKPASDLTLVIPLPTSLMGLGRSKFSSRLVSHIISH
jgi:hypothetical protein